MDSSGKNLFFVGLLLLVAITVGGIGLVDTNLTRMMQPPQPFETVAIEYCHGVEIRVPGYRFRSPLLRLGLLDREGVVVQLGGRQCKLPVRIDIVGINTIRGWLKKY